MNNNEMDRDNPQVQSPQEMQPMSNPNGETNFTGPFTPAPPNRLNPFQRASLPTPIAGVDQVTQWTDRTTVPSRRYAPLTPLYSQPTNQVNTGSVVTEQIVKQINIIGPPVPATSNTALKPSPNDRIQYLSPNGNDANDGLSWGTAKATFSSALTAIGSGIGRIIESPAVVGDGIASTGSATGLNGMIIAPTRIYIGPSAQATASVTGVDSGKLHMVGSVWTGSAAADDFWDIQVNAFSGAFSAGSNLIISHSSLEGGAGRIFAETDLVVANPRDATVSLNSNSFAFDNQGSYFDGGATAMLWEMANTVNQDGGSLATTIFRQNWVPIFESTATGVQAEYALGGSGTLGVSGNYAGPPKWLWTNLRGSSFHTMSLEHSTTTTRTITFPDATDTLVCKATTDTLTNKTYDTAGTGNVLKIGGGTVPSAKGTANQVLAMDGTGTNLVFATSSGGGGTPPFADNTAIIKNNSDATKTLTITTSGNTTAINGTLAAAFTTAKTLTLPDATDTLAGKATTDTFTNKTLDTAGTGNTLKIGGGIIPSSKGTANQVLAMDGTGTNLTFATVSGGGSSPPFADSSVLVKNSVDATKTLLFSVGGNTTGIQGTVSTVFTTAKTLTLPDATDTLVGKATTDTLTNKSYDTAGTGNSFKINGTAITAITGSGAVALATSPTFVTPTLGVASATSILTGDGSITVPAQSWTNETGSGWYRAGAGDFRFTLGGNDSVRIEAGDFTISQANFLRWGSGGVTGADTFMYRTAAGVVAFAAAQTATFGGAIKLTNTQFVGATSGVTTVQATAVAGTNTLTLPATNSDTLSGKATTDIFTNKTLSTSGTGNHIQIAAADLPTAVGATNTFLGTTDGTSVTFSNPLRAALSADAKGWSFIGTSTASAVTVGPVTTTGTFRQFMIKYVIAGYSGGTPVGRFLCGNGTPSTTALTNSFSISEGVTAPTTGAGATAIPGIPLAVTLSAIGRSGTIIVDGASGSLKVIDVIGNEGTPSVATAPTLFRGSSFFSDLGTNLVLKQFQLTVYDTLTAVAASTRTFNTGTYIIVWGRNSD